MKGRSALPRTAFLIGLLAVVTGVVGSLWGRNLLVRIPYFDVRQVEVVGMRWVAPDLVLQAAAIGEERSVWEDFADVEARLVRHPLIEGAEVRRRGRHSLRIVVREVEPLALVGFPDLKPVRGDGRVLPIDPAAVSLDLPLLTNRAELSEDSSRVEEGVALRALNGFDRVNRLDPGLASIVSDFWLQEDRGLMLNLVGSQPAQRLALPAEVDEVLLRRVRATLADLRKRGVAEAFLEARYADQIVVRRKQL